MVPAFCWERISVTSSSSAHDHADHLGHLPRRGATVRVRKRRAHGLEASGTHRAANRPHPAGPRAREVSPASTHSEAVARLALVVDIVHDLHLGLDRLAAHNRQDADKVAVVDLEVFIEERELGKEAMLQDTITDPVACEHQLERALAHRKLVEAERGGEERVHPLQTIARQ
eukprot:3591118-Prymnesium_polylepis.1